MKKFNELAEKNVVEKTMKSLEANGIKSYFVEDKKETRKKISELLPKGAEVMNMPSETLRETGIAEDMQSGKYDSVRKKLESMKRETQGREMQRIGAAPQFAVGSVNAITEDGKLMIASATGSQLPAYAYGAEHVIFVIGAQKIVKDVDEAMKRIYEYVLPLESARAKKAYGMESSVNKILLINKEFNKDRIYVIFVNEKLGF
jgi:L-lactate utilization protein LutC